MQLDNNPKTKSVAMNESELFQIHNDGAIWRYTGTPFVGWELLDSNPSTANIVAGGSKLYQQHKNGDIWEWQGGRNWTKIYTHVVPPGMGGYPEIIASPDGSLFSRYGTEYKFFRPNTSNPWPRLLNLSQFSSNWAAGPEFLVILEQNGAISVHKP